MVRGIERLGPQGLPPLVDPDVIHRCSARLAAYLLWQSPTADDLPGEMAEYDPKD